MDYSPKLKKAMQQIKDIIKENDIAAFVLLSDGDGFSEYTNEVSPSWSCAFIDPIENAVRIRLKGAEVGKARAKVLSEKTYNLFYHFAAMIGKHAMVYMSAEQMLKDKWGGEGFSGRETSGTSQNN